MYTEFIITMTIPSVGLLLIIAFYHIRLWKIRLSAVVSEGGTDTEQGPLQKQGDSLEDTDVAAVRSNRDLCVWLAIGWLFMVYTILCRTTFQSFACMDIVRPYR